MKNKYKKAFTLIEILVVIGTITIVLSAVIGLFINVLQVRIRTKNTNDLKQSGNYVLEFIGRNVRNARAVSQTVVNTTVQITSLDASGVEVPHVLICDESINDFITYDGSPLSLVQSNVDLSDCSFNVLSGANNQPDSFEFSFTLSIGVGSTVSENFSSKVSLRTYY